MPISIQTTRREMITGLGTMMLLRGLEMTAEAKRPKEIIQTVRGAIPAEKLGRTLPHEHIMVDFIGAKETGSHRWDREVVSARMLPFLKDLRKQGFRSLVDCTPAYLGRDPLLLKHLSELSGLHILTTTGYYKEPYLPDHAFTDSVDQLAERWIQESEKGIEGTDVRPGLIKIAVNPGNLIPIQQKVVRAAARASKRTGLTIACHTGHGVAALETVRLLQEEGLPLSKYIFVHADSEPNTKPHFEVAKAGGWVEYDAVGWRPIEEHVKLITAFLAEGLAERLLVSHDAGWYHVGEKNGGDIKPFTPIWSELLPALEHEGMKPEMRRQLFEINPRRAYAIQRA